MMRRVLRGLGARLVVLALVPTVGILAIGGLSVRSSQMEAANAADLDRHLGSLSELMALGLVLSDEEFAGFTARQAAGFGLTVDEAGALIGVDLAEQAVNSRASADALVDGLPSHVDPASIRRSIAAARTMLADPDSDPDATRDAFAAASATVRSALDEEVEHTSELLASASVPSDLSFAVDDLRRLDQLLSQVDRQVPLVFDVLLTIFADEVSVQPLSDLRTVTGWYTEEAASIDGTLDRPAADAWASVRVDPLVLRFERQVDRLITGGPGVVSADDVEALAQLARDGFRREELHVAVFDAQSRYASDLAGGWSDEARREATAQLVAIIAVIAVTIAVLAVVARSISRPLGRLAGAATALTEGDLEDARGSGSGGPTEVQVVRAAYDGLVQNIELLDAQADALAHNRLDDPVLASSLPGRLGASVRMSVAQLSQTMADRERLHGELLHQATHDSLTGLANRAAAQFSLESAVSRARRSGSSAAVLFVDLDDFKRANDTHGHPVGDQVLRTVADRLRSVVREESVVARLGGDEFLVIVEDASVDDLVRLADRLLEAVSQPVVVGSFDLVVGASIGIAVLSDAGETADDLLRSADIATYRAKSAGRGRAELFDDRLRHEIDRRTALETEMTEALASGEMSFVLQPIWCTVDGRLSGFEALARWTRADGSSVPPAEFIPVAEASDLVIAIDNHIMCEAARAVAAWPDTDVHVSVNVSGRHLLDRRVADDVARALRETGLDPHRLVVEITETVLVSDTEVACAHLEEIRALGVRVAIDDFGSGYTSFTHLRRLPVDVLKIDRVFVAELSGPEDGRLVNVVIEAGHALGLSVVAEGVETEEQRSLLAHLGCEEVQGFLLGRPMAIDAAQRLTAPTDRSLQV